MLYKYVHVDALYSKFKSLFRAYYGNCKSKTIPSKTADYFLPICDES